MAITHEDINEIRKVFDREYVRINDCNEKQVQFNDKLAKDDKRIEVMSIDIKQMRSETKSGLKFNNWLTSAVLGSIIAAVIAFYFLCT